MSLQVAEIGQHLVSDDVLHKVILLLIGSFWKMNQEGKLLHKVELMILFTNFKKQMQAITVFVSSKYIVD